VLVETRRQLADYFSGHRKAFDLQLDFVRHWVSEEGLAGAVTIPLGETRAYRQIASQIGNPMACGQWARQMKKSDFDRRPVPSGCGIDGDLTGFAGGLNAKAIC